MSLIIWLFAVFVLSSLLSVAVANTSNSCTLEYEDRYTIAAIIEDALTRDCVSLRILAGAFFSDLQRLPRTIRVNYTLEIPFNDECNDECCWSECSNDCSDGYCCITRDFIWGRTPPLAQDYFYRNMATCPFIVGELKERAIDLKLTLSPNSSDESVGLPCVNQRQFPCGWCRKLPRSSLYTSISNPFDIVFTHYAIPISPLDLALTTVTAKLQGYAVEAQRLSWLRYNSEIAIGYASLYNDTDKYSLHLFRYIAILFTNFFFHVVMFMLMYKFRKKIYKRVVSYVDRKDEKKALFWSFIVTTMTAFISMSYMSMYESNLCITVMEIVLYAQSLLFAIPNFALITCKLKLRPRFLSSRCGRFPCVNYSVQILVMLYLMTLPHLMMNFCISLTINFIQNPLSYIILILYFTLSHVILWIANALAIHLITSPDRGSTKLCVNKRCCRRWVFVLSLTLACNLLNCIMWTFVSVFFYDRRGRATSYLTLLPGLLLSFTGWYLSGNHSKLFQLFTLKKTDDVPEKEGYITLHDESTESRSRSATDITLRDFSVMLKRTLTASSVDTHNCEKV